ncbi:SRPBCC family protein [Yunchengibacter salinarum]|uniref:SRPBCC family protein n=1 Tax=Yunchengibacter salinarum TaxID=3133399 RepID=UPI0035B61201
MFYKPKDRFRDWNLYHKGVVALLAALFSMVVLRAVLVHDGGGFKVSAARSFDVAPSAVWPWVLENRNRTRWQTHLSDMTRLRGAPQEQGASRMLFWRRMNKSWTGVEKTAAVVPERLFHVVQQSDFRDRELIVTLDPLTPCGTRLEMVEVIVPTSFSDRFWAFMHSEEYAARLESSLKALDGWLKDRAPRCASSQPPQHQ